MLRLEWLDSLLYIGLYCYGVGTNSMKADNDWLPRIKFIACWILVVGRGGW